MLAESVIRYVAEPQVASMSRVQLALNVDASTPAIAIFSSCFGTEPAKGQARLRQPPSPSRLKLVLLEEPEPGRHPAPRGGGWSPSEQVHGRIARLAGAGLFTEGNSSSTCCFAKRTR